jgi:HlyD family secretion protein
MIDNTTAMDKAIVKTKGLPLRAIVGLVAGVVLVLTVVLALPTIRRWSRAERSIDASRLRTGQVVRGDLERDVSAEGRIVAALHPTLFSPTQGIVSLAVKAGSEVKKGQVLAHIESPELRSRLVQARSTLASLEADLGRQKIGTRQAEMRARQSVDILGVRSAAADRAQQRAETSADEGLIGKAELEKAQDDARIAALELRNAEGSAGLDKETLEFEVKTRELEVERQRSVLAELQRQVEELTVKAPFDGMVANVAAQDRDVLAVGQPILTVVDLSAFEVEFQVPENESNEVTPGTRAEIVYEGRTYPGKVTAISPEIRDSQVRGTVVFVGDPPAGLRQSQRVTTRIVLEKHVNVLKVPRGPFLESGGGRRAYVLDAGMATLRDIETGATSVSEVEVLRGLEPGEQIVLSDVSIFEGAKTVMVTN